MPILHESSHIRTLFMVVKGFVRIRGSNINVQMMLIKHYIQAVDILRGLRRERLYLFKVQKAK